MYLIGAVVLAALSSTEGGWLRDLSEGRSLDLGKGFQMSLERLSSGNDSSLFARHALRLDYSDFGLSVGKARDLDAIQVGLFMTEKEEGACHHLGYGGSCLALGD